MSETKTKALTVRLTPSQKEMLDRACEIGPYRVSITEVIALGIELASAEREAIAKSVRSAK